MPEGTLSLAEAFASVESEMDSAGSVDTEAPLPGVEVEDASAVNKTEAVTEDTSVGEQEGREPLDLEGFEDLVDADAAAAVDVSSPEFLETQVTFDTVRGSETVTIAELQKGYLRTADYTQKTQDVAEQRRAAKDAVEFYETFRGDPQEFARTIAVRAGLIDEGAEPVRNIDIAEIPTQEAIDKMVEERVSERLANAPEVQQAKLVAARAAVANEFAAIEAEFGTTLNQGQREAVIANANKRGTTDLKLVFEAMLGQLNSRRSRRDASAARPTSGAGVNAEVANEAQPNTLEEAFRQAEADLAGA